MKRLTCALLGALLLAACSSGTGNAPPSDSVATAGGGSRHPWTQPNILRVAIQRAPTTLNPVLSAFTTEGFLNRLTFDTLIAVGADGKTMEPILATAVPSVKNGGISADGLTIRYHLHHGVRWQDGAPFSSRDVKFSWQAMMNDGNNVNSRTGYDQIARVDTPEDDTVVFHLKRKFAPFVNTIFTDSDNPVCIIPEHLLGKYPNLNRVPFNEAPIGTGPFKVVKWVHGDHIELAANDDYFRGKPKLRQIIVREIPDENTTINAVRTHDIDWMFEASPATYVQFKSMADIVPGLETTPTTLKVEMNLSRPVLADVRVRQAIAYGIDKAGLVQRFTGGSSLIAGADQPPYSYYYEPNVTIYKRDVTKAKALLGAAGYTPGPGGIMQKNGQPLALQLSYNVENATRRLVAVQVQAELHDIGVDVQIKTYPGNIFFSTLGQGGILTGAKYDLAVDGWVAGIDPDDHTLFECDAFPPAGTNYNRYCSKTMDGYQREALGTYDEAQRKIAYSKIQRLLATDVPVVFVWYQRFIQAHNPDFKNFTPNPINEAWNAYQWEI